MQDTDALSKTEAAYWLLRRDILNTRLRPGASLRLSMLRDTYGVGWTPLREALSRLEAEKLVTAVSNRGFAVAPVSRAELEDLTRARMIVELPLSMESIEKGGPDWESPAKDLWPSAMLARKACVRGRKPRAEKSPVAPLERLHSSTVRRSIGAL